MKRTVFAALSICLASLLAAQTAPPNPALAPLDSLYPDLEKLYVDLHENPELSFHEEKTAAKTYRALVFGHPKPAAGRIDLPLSRDPKDGRKMRVEEGGEARRVLHEDAGHRGHGGP